MFDSLRIVDFGCQLTMNNSAFVEHKRNKSSSLKKGFLLKKTGNSETNVDLFSPTSLERLARSEQLQIAYKISDQLMIQNTASGLQKYLPDDLACLQNAVLWGRENADLTEVQKERLNFLYIFIHNLYERWELSTPMRLMLQNYHTNSQRVIRRYLHKDITALDFRVFCEKIQNPDELKAYKRDILMWTRILDRGKYSEELLKEIDKNHIKHLKPIVKENIIRLQDILLTNEFKKQPITDLNNNSKIEEVKVSSNLDSLPLTLPSIPNSAQTSELTSNSLIVHEAPQSSSIIEQPTPPLISIVENSETSIPKSSTSSPVKSIFSRIYEKLGHFFEGYTKPFNSSFTDIKRIFHEGVSAVSNLFSRSWNWFRGSGSGKPSSMKFDNLSEANNFVEVMALYYVIYSIFVVLVGIYILYYIYLFYIYIKLFYDFIRNKCKRNK